MGEAELFSRFENLQLVSGSFCSRKQRTQPDWTNLECQWSSRRPSEPRKSDWAKSPEPGSASRERSSLRARITHSGCKTDVRKWFPRQCQPSLIDQFN